MRLHHVGIAVKDLEAAMRFYLEVMGLELIGVEEVKEEGVRIAMFNAGGVRVELLQGVTPESAITKYVEKRGEGIHHIAFSVDNVDSLCRELSERGVQLTYPQPKLVSGGSRKINFIHPRSTGGVLVEVLTEVTPHE